MALKVTATRLVDDGVEEYETISEAAMRMEELGLTRGSSKSVETSIYRAIEKGCVAYGRKWRYTSTARVVDPWGKEWVSERAMAEAYPVASRETYRRRIEAGKTMEEALMAPPRQGKKVSVADTWLERAWRDEADPSTVSVQSTKKRWFKCELCGELFEEEPRRLYGAPPAMCKEHRRRKRVSSAQMILYEAVRRHVDPSVMLEPESGKVPEIEWLGALRADMYSPTLNAVIEYDGYGHSNPDAFERDVKKSQLCAEHGVTVLRVREPRLPSWNCCGDLVVERGDNYTAESLAEAVREVLELLGAEDTDQLTVDELMAGKDFRNQPIAGLLKGRPCYDHRGNAYLTIKERAAAYGKSDALVRKRLKEGMSLQEALETPVKAYQPRKPKAEV